MGSKKKKSMESYFREYLEKDLELSSILFGRKGYFKLIYKNNSLIDLYKKLLKKWGEPVTKRFNKFLETKRNNVKEIDNFEKKGIHFLYRKICQLLSESYLAEYDGAFTEIKHFRSRLIQDYFTAVYIKTVGLKSEKAVFNALDKVGKRNIIEILASLVGKKPDKLKKELHEKSDSE